VISALVVFAVAQLTVGAAVKQDTAHEAFQAKRNKATVYNNLGGVQPGTFERIFIVQYENQPYFLVSLDQYFVAYAKKGALLTNYYAVTHPSQPNYLAQIGGDFFGHNTDKNVNVSASNLVDLMEAKGISWKTYQEDFPGDCNPKAFIGNYARKHNPFMSFDNIRNNPARCAKIVNSKELDADLAAGTLPQYSYYTPNLLDDGHNTGLGFAGQALDKFLAPRLAKFPNNTLIVVTWDEDDYLSFNHIYTALIGDMVTPGTQDGTSYNHYSLLRTIEDNFELGNLGRNDAKANTFQCLTPPSSRRPMKH